MYLLSITQAMKYNSVNTKLLTPIKCHFTIHVTVISVIFSYFYLHRYGLNCIKNKIMIFFLPVLVTILFSM